MASQELDDSNYLVKIEITEPCIIKSLFTILKDIEILECNINISPEGLEIQEMDTSHIVVAHVKLDATHFNNFLCRRPVRIGVETIDLSKLLKGIDNKAVLTLFVEDHQDLPGADGEIGMSFGFYVENAVQGQTSKIVIDTHDVNDNQMEVPQLNYPGQIQMPSASLQSIVSQLKTTGGEVIKILFHKDTLQFYTKGDIASLEIVRARTNKEESSIRVMKNDTLDSTGIIELYVKLDKIVEFTKCACLTHLVSIHLMNDYPLFLEYDVGSLGFIRLGLSPHNKPETW
jgi:proliferating cell nuclear antigen